MRMCTMRSMPTLIFSPAVKGTVAVGHTWHEQWKTGSESIRRQWRVRSSSAISEPHPFVVVLPSAVIPSMSVGQPWQQESSDSAEPSTSIGSRPDDETKDAAAPGSSLHVAKKRKKKKKATVREYLQVAHSAAHVAEAPDIAKWKRSGAGSVV